MRDDRDPAEWERIEQTRFRVLAGNPALMPTELGGYIAGNADYIDNHTFIVVNHRKALKPEAIIVEAAKRTQGQLVLEVVRQEPSHAGALAGAFAAVDAVSRAQSLGKFTFPHPIYQALAEARDRAETAVQAIIKDARDAGRII